MNKPALSLAVIALLGILACNKKETTTPSPAPAPAPADSASLAPAPTPAAPAPSAGTAEMRADRIDFSMPLQGISDTALTFQAFAGKPVLLFYFGPTCPHCQAALPEIQAFAEELKAKGYQALAIANARSNPEEIQQFITEYRCRLPVVWDEERQFGEAYNVKVLPTVYLVKASGEYFQADFEGKATLDLLRSKI